MLCVLFICVICEKKNIGELSWGVPSFTKDISISHRTHRFNRTLLRTVSNPQKASGIQRTQRPHPQPLSEWRGGEEGGVPLLAY